MAKMTPERMVLKWPMTAPVQEFEMPADSRVLDVHTQAGVPTLWTLSVLGGGTLKRTFIAFGTGHLLAVNAELVYVGTAHDVEGQGLVFHIFERPGG